MLQNISLIVYIHFGIKELPVTKCVDNSVVIFPSQNDLNGALGVGVSNIF